jgi:hypothetical protein
MYHFTYRTPNKSAYEYFWKEFMEEEAILYKEIRADKLIEGETTPLDFINGLLETFEGIHAHLHYDKTKMAQILFSASQSIEKFVFVEALVQHAPKLKRWQFIPLALTPAPRQLTVSINETIKFDRNKLFFYPNLDPKFPDEVHIVVVHDDYGKEDPEAYHFGAAFLLGNDLGELAFAEQIDRLSVVGQAPPKTELIPLTRIDGYLKWRNKEFVENYEARWQKEDDPVIVQIAGFLKTDEEPTPESTKPQIMGAFNQTLLEWEDRAAYPWLLQLDIEFSAEPVEEIDDDFKKYIEIIERELKEALEDKDEYVRIGTLDYGHYISFYYGCKEFREISKIIHEMMCFWENKYERRYEIIKDKYWRSFEKYIPS